MPKKDKLTEVSVKVGGALGRANRQARKIFEAKIVAEQELRAISKQVEELARQLQKTTERLKKALS